MNSPVGYIEGCAGSDFSPSTGLSLIANFVSGKTFDSFDIIFFGSISLGIFWEEVLGYEIIPSKYKDCANCRVLDGEILNCAYASLCKVVKSKGCGGG